MNHTNVLIIGGGPAGRSVARALRSIKGNEIAVTLIKDEEVNANRCSIPYGISPAKPPEKFMIPNKLVTDAGAELVIDQVEAIDTGNSQLVTSKGEHYSYDHLVLATGARAVIPPIPGVESQNIVPLRTREDMLAIRDFGQRLQKAVVVGGGYIGVEVAVVLRSMGLAVTIIERLPHLVSLTMEAELIGDIEERLQQHGIQIFTGTTATEFVSSNGTVTGVQLENGSTIDADFVVLAVGVVPNLQLASASGIHASSFGFVTDDFLRTNIPNIFATGDCAEKRSFITRKPTRGEFGTNAVAMSKVVTANILGKQRRFPGVINTNAVAAFDFSFGSAGITETVARAEGMDIVSGYSEVLNKYPMMDGVDYIKTKLLFERSTGKLIGGSVLRKDHSTVHNVDFLSLAMQMSATVQDIAAYQYATHPEMAARPSDNMYVFAAQDALKKL